jgi:hypothetical protein
MNAAKLAVTVAAASVFALATTGCSASAASPVARQPVVAFGATPSELAGACTMDGTPRVVATHVVPRGGVTAVAHGGSVWLRFETTRDARAVMAIDPRTLEAIDAGDAPAEQAAPAAPVRVQLDGGRSMVAWTEGTDETGLSVKVATVDAEGVTTPPADLGFEGSAIGRPAVASTPQGQGVVAFVESSGIGFHLVVTRVTCPAAPAR